LEKLSAKNKVKIMKLSIITVNFGHSKKIEKLLESVKNNPPSADFEFIVVDNDSPNNDWANVEELCKTLDNCHVIKIAENRGFGAGNNEAAKFAKGEFLAFVNPDILVEKKCFDELLKVFEDGNIGISSPSLVNPDGSKQISARKFPTLAELFYRRFLNNKESESQEFPDWVHGSFMVMKKSLFEKIGGFDDRFFLFFEDTDLCHRVWEQKLRVALVKNARAVHNDKRLSGKDAYSVFNKYFWIHALSAVKYFLKWRR